jgi:hypothetical protein
MDCWSNGLMRRQPADFGFNNASIQCSITP